MSKEIGFGQAIWEKAKVLRLIRFFFDNRDFLEVDTDILQVALVPEWNVPSFYLPCCNRYLLPSPELAMKKLLCNWNIDKSLGSENDDLNSIYQLAHCFRQEEEQDILHSWEFLMLEFYGLNYNALQLLALLDQLLQELSEILPLRYIQETELVLLSFDELCHRALGLEFNCYWAEGLVGMRELYARMGCQVPDLSLDDLFHLFLVEFLEPYIANELPYCALYPYPDVTPLPAKLLLNEDSKEREIKGAWVDRWELYLNGMELANGCCEENRAEYLQRYHSHFLQCAPATVQNNIDKRNSQQKEYGFRGQRFDFSALELWQNLPDCSGAAMGVSRLFSLASL